MAAGDDAQFDASLKLHERFPHLGSHRRRIFPEQFAIPDVPIIQDPPVFLGVGSQRFRNVPGARPLPEEPEPPYFFRQFQPQAGEG